MIRNDPMLYPSESGVNYLCFTANTAGSTVALNVVGTPTQGQAFEYSTDAQNWSEYVPGTTGAITLASVGDKVYFRGDNTTVSESTTIYHQFAMTGSVAGSGSIMTLLDKTDTLRSLAGTSYAFNRVFYNCTSLTSAPELPATTLAQSCYVNMFYECRALTAAPELPATIASPSCYRHMFRNCTSLTSAPELPATTLANTCYANMFYGCSSLTSAPELPATTISHYCYQYMFYNCSSLTSAPELPSTALANYCYQYMFYNCRALASIKLAYTGAFSSAPTNAFTSWVDGVAASGDFYYNGTDTTTGTSAIPSGWTVHTF